MLATTIPSPPVRPAFYVLLLALLAPACSMYRGGRITETPDAPFFDDMSAARVGMAAHASGDVARILGARLQAYGLQPVARADRRLALGRDTIAAAFVPGKDALWHHRLVVVAVSEAAGPGAIGAFAELARVTARLARQARFPEPTVLFATLPEGEGAGVLQQLSRGPTWLADSVHTVVLIGEVSSSGPFRGVPLQHSAGATARSAYEVMHGLASGLRPAPVN
jgi:hypothetical protein